VVVLHKVSSLGMSHLMQGEVSARVRGGGEVEECAQTIH